MTTWVCRECGCDVAEYGVCRCFDDETECFCAECAWETHGIRLILGSAAKPVMNNELDQLKQRLTELEEMLKQPMQNNDNLRNDNYQLKARVSELEASNKEMLAELERNMRFCCDGIYHSCDGCVLNESCSLRKSIDRAKGLQQ
jgi:hypothetical protein